MSGILAEYLSDCTRLFVALGIGAVIGAEREYRSKAAGFRTLILICVGAALFTLLSIRLGTEASHDRVASNIVVGIGFIGAGVIFKDGVNIAGLTTATSIWVTAALGMAAGAGEFVIAAIGLVLVLMVLALFERLQLVIDRWNQTRPCVVRFHVDRATVDAMDEAITACSLRTTGRKVQRDGQLVAVSYSLTGAALGHRKFLDWLLHEARLDGFEY